MTYARARLWLSISGVLTIVILSVLLLLFNVPNTLLPNQQASFGTELQALILVVFIYILVSFPFDIFGGYILPKEYKISEQSLAGFLIIWLRGVVTHGIIYVAIALLLIQIGRSLGFLFFVLFAAVLMVLLILIQKPLIGLVGSMHTKEVDFSPYAEQLKAWGIPMPAVISLNSTDKAFMGGVVGIPSADEIIVPAAWTSKLTPDELSILLARRAELMDSGGRGRGAWGALLSNLIGFIVVSMLLANVASIGTVSGIVTIALAFTVWSFLTMLALPSLNKQAVSAADRNLGVLGLRKTQLRKTFTTTEKLQDKEAPSAHELAPAVYDIPLVEQRLAAMEESGPVKDYSFWNISRYAPYLSWVGLNFLSRMAPHTLGRPELWVLSSGD